MVDMLLNDGTKYQHLVIHYEAKVSVRAMMPHTYFLLTGLYIYLPVVMACRMPIDLQSLAFAPTIFMSLRKTSLP